jgi:hypothetical protein
VLFVTCECADCEGQNKEHVTYVYASEKIREGQSGFRVAPKSENSQLSVQCIYQNLESNL